jgi:hypothetical protein
MYLPLRVVLYQPDSFAYFIRNAIDDSIIERSHGDVRDVDGSVRNFGNCMLKPASRWLTCTQKLFRPKSTVVSGPRSGSSAGKLNTVPSAFDGSD